MIDDFILHALIAGFGISIATGFIGCFIIWRRMAYFGDSLSHSALLGIALGLVIGININIAIMLVCFLFALILLALQQKKTITTDTILGILAHTSLSLGIVLMGFFKQKIDIHSYLFGDILTVTTQEIYWIFAGSLGVIVLFIRYWAPLLLLSIDEALAQAENINTFKMRFILMIATTIIVAISIRTIGVLLVTSLMIIPAATARQITKSPEMMVVVSIAIAMASTLCGILLSTYFDTLTTPTIVIVSSASFAIVSMFSRFLSYSR